MADTERDAGLEERLDRLEAVVARLVAQVEGRASRAEPRPAPDPAGPSPAAERTGPARGPDGLPRFEWAQGPAGGTRASADARPSGAPGPSAGSRAASLQADDLAASGERWLGRVGVAFVVLAFGFLFKYAFDQGWIGPAFRLVLGFLAATAMLVVGLRLEGARERYSQYLLGGSIAVYYLVAYASYALYGLLPFALAFALMSATTVLAFVLAERQRLSSLAVIGAAGGLATPFLVSTGSENVPALVAYTTLLLAGAGTLQFWRGWRLLLLVLGLGGLAVTGAATVMASGTLESVVAAVGVLAAWALWGALPLLRAELRRLEPALWPDPVGDAEAGGAAADEREAAVDVMALLRLGCWAGSLVALLQLGELLSASRAGHAPLFLTLSLIYAAFAWRFFETRAALNTAAEVASGLLAVALVLWLFDARAFLPLAMLGAGMHLADSRWSLRGVGILSHALFALLAGSFLARAAVLGSGATLGISAEGSPFGFLELAILGAVVLAATIALTLASRAHRSVYLLGAHIAFMIWLAYQLAPLGIGQELISLSWGVYGIVLLLVAMRRGEKDVQLVGLATLGVVALKLLVVDMAQVDVIWRILLFMGFGAAFLGLSYLINRRPAKG